MSCTNPKYFGIFAEAAKGWNPTAPGIEKLLKEFNIPAETVYEHEILFATYDYEDYSGYAIVVFERDGVLYYVEGAHCSCHGLGSCSYSSHGDTQWQPEETSWTELLVKDFHNRHWGMTPQAADYLLELIRSNVTIH